MNSRSGAAPDDTYVVRASCTGDGTATYSVIIDGDATTGATLECGTNQVNSAFSGSAGTVEVEFTEITPGIVGFAEVIAEGDL